MSRVRGSDRIFTGKQHTIPGEKDIKNKKREMREAGIKQCRGCQEFKILYRGGYCGECRREWMNKNLVR